MARGPTEQTVPVTEGAPRQIVIAGLIAKSQYYAAETEAGVWKTKVRASEEALNLLLAGPKSETVKAAWTCVQEAELKGHAQDRRARGGRGHQPNFHGALAVSGARAA